MISIKGIAVDWVTMDWLIWVVVAFVVAAVISFALSPLVRSFAFKIGAIDVPKDTRRMHKSPIPRLGGLAIFFGFFTSVLLFCHMSREMKGILLGAVVIVVLGIIDDILSLKARYKFVLQIIAALIPVLSGLRINFFTDFSLFSNPGYFNLGLLSAPITVLWIVGLTNAVNLIDGLDGLAVGVSSIASFSLLLITIISGHPAAALLAAALTGACLGFLPYNLNPARMFMGDTGATFLGYILACITIQGLFKFYALVSFAVPFLILGLPIFDTAFAIIRRVSNGHSPMHADRGHLHHRLVDLGLTQKQTVAILYSVSAILGLSAVILAGSGIVKAGLLILTGVIVGFITWRIIIRNDYQNPSSFNSRRNDETCGCDEPVAEWKLDDSNQPPGEEAPEPENVTFDELLKIIDEAQEPDKN